MVAFGLQPKPDRLTGWKIIRTPDGLRLHVPVDWTVAVDRTGTMFTNRDKALDSLDAALAPQTFRALIISGSLEELPLPEHTGRSEVAVALAAPSLSFPHQRELEEIVGNLSYQAVEAKRGLSPIEFWLEHGQTIRRLEQDPPLYMTC